MPSPAGTPEIRLLSGESGLQSQQEASMSIEYTSQSQGLTEAEVEALEVEQLPDREQMSLINANVAAPVDAAVAANVLTSQSGANAQNGPDAPIDQQHNLLN
jgi:hypothetical protein